MEPNQNKWRNGNTSSTKANKWSKRKLIVKWIHEWSNWFLGWLHLWIVVGYERRAPLYRGATRFIKSFLFWFHSTSLLSVWFAPAKTSQPKEISLFFFNETAEGGMREEEENGPGGETHNQLPANWKSLIFIEGPGQTQLFFPLIPQKLHEWEEKF